MAASVALGVLLSVVAAWGQSEAAFTGTTTSTGSWSTGTVSLSDDDSGSALITAALAAGQSASACIQVTYTGTAPAPVRLYATGGSDVDGLGSQVALTVMEGSGATAGRCDLFVPVSASIYTGTFGAFRATKTDWSSGVSAWTADPATSTTRSYRFIWTVDEAASATYAGTSVSATFVWESKA